MGLDDAGNRTGALPRSTVVKHFRSLRNYACTTRPVAT